MSPAQNIAEAQAALDAAESALHRHLEKTRTLAVRKEGLEAQQRAALEASAESLSQHLLSNPAADLPETATPDLTLQIRVLEMALLNASGEQTTLEGAIRQAKRALRDSKLHRLQALKAPALSDFMKALDAAFEHAARVVGCEVVAREAGGGREFGASSRPDNIWGPAGEIMHFLANFSWPDELRPNWAPLYPSHADFWPADRPAAVAAAGKIRAELAA